MNDNVLFLTNDYYKTLDVIYSNQITVDNESFCPLSQAEIAKLVGLSRNTVGIYIKELKERELIAYIEGTTKKYILTDKAKEIIKKIRKI